MNPRPAEVRFKALAILAVLLFSQAFFSPAVPPARAGAAGTAGIAPPNWTSLGPAPLLNATVNGQNRQDASGRILAVAVHPANSAVILLGSAQGGIWKTSSGGASFTPVADNLPSLAINVIRFAPANPAIVYAGSGEPHGLTSLYGQGVFKSGDGGNTWQALPASGAGWDFRYAAISGLRVHPTDPNTLYVTSAAIRSTVDWFNPPQTPQTGIFKSVDGGQTWTLLKAAALYPASTPEAQGNAGFMDLEMGSASLLYASEYGGGIWKSTNAGASWNLITPLKGGGGADLPAAVADYAYFVPGQAAFFTFNRLGLAGNLPEFSRVELGLSQANPEILYAGYAALLHLDSHPNGVYEPGLDISSPASLLFKSVNGGASWTWLGDWYRKGVPDYCASQCDYANTLEVNPANPNDILIGGTANTNPIWPDPLNPPARYLQLPERGMVYRSLDGGTSWVDTTPQCTAISAVSSGLVNGLPLYPCSPNQASKVIHPGVHSLSYDPGGAALIYAGSEGGFNRAAYSGSSYTWENVNHGLATLQLTNFDVHPTDPNLFIGGAQDNALVYWNGTTWEGWGFGSGTFGAFDPLSPGHVYMGTQSALHRHDSGGTQDVYAPGSGWNLSIFQPQVGDSPQAAAPFAIDPVSSATVYTASQTGLYRSDNRGAAWGSRVNPLPLDGSPTSISVSPANHNFVYVSTSSGWVYLFDYQNGLVHQRGASLPGRYPTRVLASPNAANTLYMAYSGYNSTAPAGKIFKSTDAGLTFADISASLADVPVSALALDPHNEQRIWAGTPQGVFVTLDGGTTWSSYRGNMPVVAVMDLKYNPTTGYLSAATFGRGAWRINPDQYSLYLPDTLKSSPPQPVFPALLNPNFDLGHTAWLESSTTFPDLLVPQSTGGAPAAHSGTWLAWLGGANNETSDLSQPVTFPAGIGPTFLNFYYQISSSETNCSTAAPADALYLYINDTYADGIIVCNSYNTGPTWTAFSFAPDLSAYAGQTVTLHIRLVTNSTLSTSVFMDTLYFARIQALAALPAPQPQSSNLRLSGAAAPDSPKNGPLTSPPGRAGAGRE